MPLLFGFSFELVVNGALLSQLPSNYTLIYLMEFPVELFEALIFPVLSLN